MTRQTVDLNALLDSLYIKVDGGEGATLSRDEVGALLDAIADAHMKAHRLDVAEADVARLKSLERIQTRTLDAMRREIETLSL
jgi:hypothetical protein